MGKRRRRKRWNTDRLRLLQYIGVGVLASVTLVMVWFVFQPDPEPVAADRPAATRTPTETPTPTAEPAPAIALPAAGERVVFFGDSWTYGEGANAPTDSYAYVTGATYGWDAIVDGLPGTGFVNPGRQNLTYVQRSAALAPDESVRLVVLQGSVNEIYINQELYPDLTLFGLKDAVAQTVANLRAAYPNAQIVALGPTSGSGQPPSELVVVNGTLRIAYDGLGVPFIKAIDWITPSNYAQYINKEALNHPNADGYAYLAGRLVEELNALAS